MLLMPVLLAVCFAPITSDSVEADFEVREKIVYSKVADRELLLDAWIPNKDGVHPAVLVVHGGAWRSGDRMEHVVLRCAQGKWREDGDVQDRRGRALAGRDESRGTGQGLHFSSSRTAG